MEKVERLLTYLKERNVKLVAVSKTKTVKDILSVYEKGQRIFGENRAQELAEKQPQLPEDIAWHMIGHLQSNKVKYIAAFVAMIHSCDGLKLLKTINKEALKHNRIIPVLLQLHIATEESKFGLTLEEAESILSSEEFKVMHHVSVNGVMGMATFTEDMDVVRAEFKNLKSCFDHLKAKYFGDKEHFSEISMGMSGDYEIAIDEGSTIVRIGSLIFGARN